MGRPIKAHGASGHLFQVQGQKDFERSWENPIYSRNSLLESVMNGKTTLPAKNWKTEYAKLSADH